MMILRVSKGPFLSGREDPSEPRRFGLNLECAETGHEALEYLRVYDYDLMLADMNLHDTNATDLIRQARQAGHATPIIVLAGAMRTEQRVQALDQGADDVITMPADPAEVIARIRTVIRRVQGHATATLRLGPVELRLDRREVTAHGKKLTLTRREFSTLELLFLRQGAILTKTAFLSHLYCGAEEPEVKSVDVTICRVRKKLAAAGVPHLIDTVWGCGYILRLPEQKAEAQATPAAETNTFDLAAWRDSRGRAQAVVS